jgi:hypothetical protein
MDAPDDDRLEQALRAGLESRADEAEVDRGLVARAAADARGRRTTRRRAVLGAAAAVVAVVGVTAVVTGGDDVPSGIGTLEQDLPLTTTPPSAVGPVRTEYWKGVQVEVPASWGYGNPALCGDVPRGEPYVGRPIGITDACISPDPDATPTAPYVWFDVDGVEPGTAELGGGWTRVTVELAGVRVSVAGRGGPDPRIMESIRRQSLCPEVLAQVPMPRLDWTREGGGTFESAYLCAYRNNSDEPFLAYAAPVDQPTWDLTSQAVESAPAVERCTAMPTEVVVVTGVFFDPWGARPLHRDLVYDIGCGRVLEQGPGFPDGVNAHRITEPTLPWAGPEFRRLLVGPGVGPFIGMQG